MNFSDNFFKRVEKKTNVDKNTILDLADKLQKSNMKDEKVLKACRDNFKKLEDGDKYCVEIWNKFKEIIIKDEC